MKTHDARRFSPEAQEALRRRAVRAVRNGMSKTEAAKVFGVSRTAIWDWTKKYAQGGEKALRAQKRGPKRKSRLAPWQAAVTVRLITDRHPEQLKLPCVLWTRQAVRQLLEQKFGIDVSVWTVGRYLKGWGLTPQKPLRKALEQNPKAVRRWLNQEYPSIHRQAKREHGEVHWGDEMGMRSDHQTGRSYGRKGETPVIPGTGQRFSCHLISSITNRGTLRFLVYRKKLSADIFIAFLRRLIRDTTHKVFLIVDRHPVHKSHKVRRWLEKHKSHIRMFFLPAYSPELNPDEMLKNDVKSNAVGRERPRNCEHMERTVRRYLRSTQKQPHIVRSYFQEESVRYAAT